MWCGWWWWKSSADWGGGCCWYGGGKYGGWKSAEAAATAADAGVWLSRGAELKAPTPPPELLTKWENPPCGPIRSGRRS